MLGSKAKRELKRNQRRILIDSIEIGIPSPQQIYTWGERQLPNGKKVGEIKNSKTVNYKRFTPLRDGLFCERIFGPVNSFVCACGKRQPRADVTFCDKCEVEYTDQRTRRYRLGYIPLVSPVAHIWYLKGRPSYLSLFLGKRKKKLVALTYCNAYLVEQSFCQMPQSNLALAATDALSSTQKREAHGISKYTKNIQSSSAIQQISNLFYNSPESNFYTNQNSQTNVSSNLFRQSLDTGSRREVADVKTETLSNGKPFQVEPKVIPLGNPDSHNTFLSNFQQKINKKTSPSRFYYLLAEVLGHIKKDVVLTDIAPKHSPSKDYAQDNQETQKLYTEKTFLLSRKEKEKGELGSEPKSLLSLHPLWGYTYFEKDRQDLLKMNTLFETTNPDSRKEKAIANTFSDVYQVKSRGTDVLPFYYTPALRRDSPKMMQDITASTCLLSNIFAQTSFLSHYSWSAQEWSRLFSNYASYQPSFKSIQPILTLASTRATKKVFQTDPKRRSSQLTFKAFYQLPFSPMVERWLSSFFTASGITSKEIIYFPSKTCLKVLFFCSKNYKLPARDRRERMKILDAYNVPFSLRLIANLQKKSSRFLMASNLERETLIATVKEQRYKTFPSGDLIGLTKGITNITKYIDTPFRASASSSLKVIPSVSSIGSYPERAHDRSVKKREEAFNKKDKNTINFSTCGPFGNPIQALPKADITRDSTFSEKEARNTEDQPQVATMNVDWQKTTQDFYYNRNKRIKTTVDKKDRFVNARSSPKVAITQPTPTQEPSLRITAQTPEKVVNSYNRAHSFPFLPSFICKYNLRDDLLNFLNSSPFPEDKPIFTYCKLKRWQPLRDVHQFMSEQVLSESIEGGKKVNAFSDRNTENTSVLYPERVTPDSLTKSIGENSHDMLFKDFDSKSQKINGLALQGEEQRGYATWVRRSRDSARDANLLQATEGVTTEYTLLEKLASLRHVLYVALLEKSFSLGATELAARTHKMSCLLTSISREKLLYDSVKYSRFTKTSLKAFNKKNKSISHYKPVNPNFIHSTENFNDALHGSKALAKHINATRRNKIGYSKSRDKVTSAIQFLNLAQPTWSLLRARYENGKGTVSSSSKFRYVVPLGKKVNAGRSSAGSQPVDSRPLQEVLLSRRLRLHTNASPTETQIQTKRGHPFHYLLRKFGSQMRYNSKLKISPNAVTKKNSPLPTATPVISSQKLSSLIGLANTLNFRSPERSYRSLLLDKTWLRSFLLEKNLLDKEYNSTSGVSKGLTLSKNKNRFVLNQNRLIFSSQTRSTPSQIHALRQHVKKAKQFNSFVLLIKNAWRVNSHKTSLPSFDLKVPPNGTTESEAETLALKGAWMPAIDKRVRSLEKRLVQYNSNIANNIVKKNIAAHEKRLINKVYNLTFVLTDSEIETRTQASIMLLSKRQKETFFASQLIPPPTKMMEVNHLTTHDEGKIRLPKTLSHQIENPGLETLRHFGQWKGQAWKRWQQNLPQVTQKQESRENILSSALSFFLILPHSQRVQPGAGAQSKKSQPVLTARDKNVNSLDNLTGLQVQLKNGNSQLFTKSQSILSNFLHHIYVSSPKGQCATSPSRVPLRKPALSQHKIPLAMSDISSNISDITQTSSANKSIVSKESTAKATSQGNPANNNTWSFVARVDDDTAVSTTPQSLRRRESIPVAYRYQKIFRDRYNNKKSLAPTINAEALQKTKLSVNSFPIQEEIRSLTQHNKKKASSPADSATMPRQSTAFSSLELATIREILSYTGGGALQKLLQRFDTQQFAMFLFADIQATRAIYKQRVVQKNYPPNRAQKRILTRLCRRIYKNSRRLKITQLLTRSKRRPEWMLISVLPVLPPDLRPILQMSESVVVASDLNNLYQRVVYRNNRFYKLSFIDFHLVTAIQRLVQDAVDRLIENGKGGSKPFYTPGGRPLKSLSDTLKGKKGRFRLNLLGKRVDFSGRSVIVVSPSFKVHECGLPREIALELYHYFLLRELMLRKHASSIIMAKKIIKQRNAFVWDVLRDIVYHHPVLLNRAPTLHRLGIQAFQPKLVKGNAILLNPLVCSGFNADFDGDQMGVHLPLSTQARAEAWDLLWSRNNLLSPATGQPVLVPSQDMVLGFYYMTQSLSTPSLLAINQTSKQFPLQTKKLLGKSTNALPKDITASQMQVVSPSLTPKEVRTSSVAYKNYESFSVAYTNRVFLSRRELIQAFQNKQINLHTPVWLQWQGKMENDEGGEKPLELRINSFGSSTYIYSKYKRRKDESLSQLTVYIRTTAGRVLVNSILFSF